MNNSEPAVVLPNSPSALAAFAVGSSGREASSSSPVLTDGFGRRIDYMRVSLTDRCMLRCLYCMPPAGRPYLPHAEILRYEELLRICGVAAGLGISRYKVTGGEPLCRKGATGFMRALKALPGVENVTLTSNGLLLRQMLAELSREGAVREALDGLTVSLDALSQAGFRRVTRSNASVAVIPPAMAEAAAVGLPVKINTVPMRGINEDELLPLTRFAFENHYIIRFIELMPVGKSDARQGVSRAEMTELLEKEFGPLEAVAEHMGNGPAVYMRPRGSSGTVGFISALSHAFCRQCNRVRLTSTGMLKTCLYHNQGLQLKPFVRVAEGSSQGTSDEALAQALRTVIAQKPEAHAFVSQASDGGPDFYMHSVGG